MKAVWYDQPGPAQAVLQYGEVETPSPGPGEVRVKVHASGINPSDTQFRSGWMGLKQPYDRTIPHNDGAGVIDAVGTGVERDRLHQRVWNDGAQRGCAITTHAKLVACNGCIAIDESGIVESDCSAASPKRLAAD